MIFDHLDICSKRSIGILCARWLEDETNLANARALFRQCNIRSSRVSERNTDEGDLMHVLAMLAAGVMIPVQNNDTFNLAVRRDWQVPAWVFVKKAWKKVMLHIEQILESMEIQEFPALLLPGAAARFRRHNMITSLPRSPHTNIEQDLKIQSEIMSEGENPENLWIHSAKHGSRTH